MGLTALFSYSTESGLARFDYPNQPIGDYRDFGRRWSRARRSGQWILPSRVAFTDALRPMIRIPIGALTSQRLRP
jgi:hypothetical protein